jgi:hypothetical protein
VSRGARRGLRRLVPAAATSLVAAALVASTLVSAPVLSASPAGAASPTWSVGHRYAPSMLIGVDVACPTRRVCYQLSLTTTGLSAVRTTTDGGLTWTTVLTAGPGVGFDRIACWSRTACVAVDGENALRTEWTSDAGASWRDGRLPPGTILVTGVVCAADATCDFVGIDGAADPVFLWTRDRGQTWHEHAIDPFASAALFQLPYLVAACVTWRDCVVGQRESGARVLEETLDAGRHWREVRLPPRFGELAALSCTRAGHCAAAGFSAAAGTVATSGDGGARWRLTLRTRSVPSYLSVACTARGACVASGATSDLHLVTASTTDGVRWHETPITSLRITAVPVVSCAAHACTVVTSVTSALELTESSKNLGRSWRDLAPEQHATTPLAASCPAPGTCEVVGDAATGALAERTTDDGTTFTRQSLPNGILGLTRVSCGSTLSCQALGVGGVLEQQVLLGTTDGGASWSFEAIPHGVADLSSIACATATACVAIGINRSLETVILWTSDGGVTWTVGNLNGVDEQLSEPLNVACTSSSDCIVALLAIPMPGFLVTTDGGADWNFAASPVAANVGIGEVPIEVACVSSTTCVSIGENLFGGGFDVLLSADGGTSWRSEDVFGADVDQVSPLACEADGACQDVGATELTAKSYFLTSLDDGQHWSSSPMPTGWLASLALSCPSSTSCFSVGITADGGLAVARYS